MLQPRIVKVVGHIHRTFLRGDKIYKSPWITAFNDVKDMRYSFKSLKTFCEGKAIEGEKNTCCFDLVIKDSIVNDVPCSYRVMKLAQKEFGIA